MILVTGGTGKVGSELVTELRKAGAAFRVGTRSPEKAGGAEAVLLDFDRPETFGPALEGIDLLFLLTSGGTEREAAAVDAAKTAGVRRIVKLSVWGADGEDFIFGRWHRAIEKKIEASGVPYTLLRPNGFMQNLSTSHAGSIRAQGAFFLCAGDTKHSIIDARDVGAVAARTLTEKGHEGRTYTLCGPETLANMQMAEKISRAIGKTIQYVDLPVAEFRKALTSSGMPEPYAEALIDLQRHYATGAFEGVTPDVERLLGREPISFDRFARDHASAWR